MQGMTRYHVGIIVTGVLLCFGPATMLMNSWSVFMVPVSQAYKVSTSAFSLMPCVLYLASALFAAPAGRLISRFGLRTVLAVSSLVAGISVLACGFTTQLWQLYVLGAFEGCAAVVFMFLMLPNMISRWFSKNMGTVVGACIAMCGFGGAVWAYLGGVVMLAASWRVAYIVLGVASLLLSLPACLFLMHDYPNQLGLLPYGAPLKGAEDPQSAPAEGPVRGVSAKRAFSSSVFWLLVVGIALLDAVITVANLLPTYIYHLGDTEALALDASQVVLAASSIALFTQASQACFKLVLGVAVDRSVLFSYVFAVAGGMAAMLCFLFGYRFIAVLFAGGVLFGTIFSVLDVFSPVMVRQFFGDRDYPEIYARFAAFVNFCPAVAVVLFARLSNFSWTFTFVLSFVFLATTMACGLLAMHRAKGLQAHFDEG